MRAIAGVTVECRSPGTIDERTRISRLRSEPPLVLRPTVAAPHTIRGGWGRRSMRPAHVALVAGAAGPIGGDHLELDIDVGPGAALMLRAVAATVALPGPAGEPSYSHVTIKVGAHGLLVWQPGTLIAAKGCAHRATTTIHLEPHARLLLREELVLGRHGEPPGSIRQHVRVTLDGRALLDQQLDVGPGAAGWNGPAVAGGRRALGSVLIVDPAENAAAEAAPRRVPGGVARMTLAGGGQLVSAAASDAPTLRGILDESLVDVDEPRSTSFATTTPLTATDTSSR